MNAAAQSHPGAPDIIKRQERLGRVSGFLYLVLALVGMFSVIVLESLVTWRRRNHGWQRFELALAVWQ